MRLPLWQKLTIALLLPIVVELLCLPVLLMALQQMEEQSEEQIRSQEFIQQAHLVSNELSDYARVLSGYVVSRDTSFLDKAEQLSQSAQLHVTQMAKTLGPQRSISVQKLNDKIKTVVNLSSAMLKDFSNSDASGEQRSIDKVKQIHSLEDALNQDVNSLVSGEEARSQSLIRSSKVMRRRLETIALWGFAIQILICTLVIWRYTSHLANSLAKLKNNAYKLVSDQPLAAAIEGDDEFSSLDQTLHSVSAVLKATKRRERAMIDNALDLICSIDKNGKLTDVSASCTDMLGYSQSELIGMRIAELVNPGNERFLEDLAKVTQQGSDFRSETVMLHKSGKNVDVQWSGSYSEEDGAIFCIVHDITKRRLLEKYKSDSVAMLTHDLRSPLTGLNICFELLELGHFGLLNEEGIKTAQRGQSVIKRIISLITDLLYVDRMESEALDLELSSVPVAEIFTEALDSVQQQAIKAAIVVETFDNNLNVFCDKELIVRTTTNLLANAIKFSPAQCRIELSCQRGNDWLEVKVTDQGRGIPPDKLEQIFERYKQVTRADSKLLKGAGLGLPICKAIVEAHKGTIGVVSEEGRGSTFWFRLPVNNGKGV